MSLFIAAPFIAAALLASAGAQAAGRVEVSWVKPELFSDIGQIRWQREATLQALGDHLQRLGQRLPDGQTLQIEVTDVDLAGELDRSSWHETRVLRGGADVPRIALRYTLLADGRTVKAGEASLSELNYLGAPLLPPSRQEELFYEKQLLERWFRETFAAP
jgi:hypothetical protein